MEKKAHKMKQDELILEEMKYSSREDHKPSDFCGVITYHSVINCKREPHDHIEIEVQTVKTNNSCTLNRSADSSHIILKSDSSK